MFGFCLHVHSLSPGILGEARGLWRVHWALWPGWNRRKHMNRLKQLFRETFPDLDPHPVGLTVMSLAMLTLYVRMGNRRFTPQWWMENVKEWTGFGDNQLLRYWWKETACFVLLMVIPLILMKVFAGWSPRDLGLRLKGTSKEFGLILVLWVAFLPVLWFVSDLPEFAKTYPQVRASKADMAIFRFYS